MLEALYILFFKVLSLSAMASVLALLILAARFLLKLLEGLPGPVRLAGTAGISSGKKEMERRIIMIARHKKATAINAMLGLAVIMALGGCTLTGAKLNSTSAPLHSNTPAAATENSSSAASPEILPLQDPSVSGDKGTLLAEKDGIAVTAKPTAKNGLLHEVTVDVRGEVNRTFFWDAIKTRLPLIDEADVNGDGSKEIIIRIWTGTGTGLSMSDIHVLQSDTLEELAVENPVEALNQRLKSSITQRNSHTYVSAELDGRHLSKVYDYTEGAWGEKVGLGANVSYDLRDGHIVVRMAGAASMTEFPLEIIAVYGKELTLESAQMYAGSFMSPPLSGEEIKSMMEDWLDPASGWTFGEEGGQYTMNFTGVPEGGGNGRSYTINPLTGTVHDTTSGSPLKSLVNRESIDLGEISDGNKYLDELYKLLQPILDAEGLEPARKEWISGFLGDGYLFGEVKKAGREFTIKADVFTGQWEEIPDPFK